MVISYAMRFCLSIAITEMTSMPLSKEDNKTCPLPNDYYTKATMKETEFNWTGSQQGVVNSAFFWGYVFGHIPGGVAADKFGGRKIVTLGAFFTGVFSILSPYAAKMFGWLGLVAVRIFVGLSQGLFYASTHTVVGQWIPKEERGTLGTFIFSGVHIGNALNMLFSGVFLYYTQHRWDLLFVIYGVIGVVWSLCFFFTTYDTPADHPFLSQYEKNILKTKVKSESEATIKPPKKTPWKSILTSLPVWAAAIAMIGHDFGLFAMITDLPKFFKTVLHFSIKNNGALNALTFILIWVVGIFAGILSDYVDNHNIISVTANRKIGTTLASLLPSLGFISSVYVGCDTTLATVCLLVGQAFMGFYYPSLKVNTIDLSTNFAGTVSSMVVTVGSLSGAVVPYLIGSLTPNNSISEWRIVMWITFAVMSVTNVFYLIFASGELQPWDDVEENTVQKSPSTRSRTGTLKNI